MYDLIKKRSSDINKNINVIKITTELDTEESLYYLDTQSCENNNIIRRVCLIDLKRLETIKDAIDVLNKIKGETWIYSEHGQSEIYEQVDFINTYLNESSLKTKDIKNIKTALYLNELTSNRSSVFHDDEHEIQIDLNSINNIEYTNGFNELNYLIYINNTVDYDHPLLKHTNSKKIIKHSIDWAEKYIQSKNYKNLPFYTGYCSDKLDVHLFKIKNDPVEYLDEISLLYSKDFDIRSSLLNACFKHQYIMNFWVNNPNTPDVIKSEIDSQMSSLWRRVWSPENISNFNKYIPILNEWSKSWGFNLEQELNTQKSDIDLPIHVLYSNIYFQNTISEWLCLGSLNGVNTNNYQEFIKDKNFFKLFDDSYNNFIQKRLPQKLNVLNITKTEDIFNSQMM